MLTQNQLREVLTYCRDTGSFRWNNKPSSRVPLWSCAGTLSQTGYVKIQIQGAIYSAHALAILYETGECPSVGLEVDHINRDRSDNRIVNLRVVTKSGNQQNQSTQRRNLTGCRGVVFHKASGKFAAAIRINKVKRHLGLFENLDDAHEFVALARAMTMPYSMEIGVETHVN